MALIPGSRLGPYEILAAIGAGGMGEVYRAADRNLKRSVAIKVLPGSVASDADRLARFQREAEVLAALNHPNVGAIYGLEKTADLTALVMELVEGEDLSQRIARGAIPIDEALANAKQIADALEAAHEQGIIHRDLKPANIKVRSDGTVKVLDFGLAKALVEDPASARAGSHTASPTITSPAMMTGAGMILGTAAYMAPEQAKGRAVDKRADIWAFGVVLYEMLTGSHPFLAATIPETLAHVMTRPIDLGTLPAVTPRRIRDLLARCLEKDPKKRLRDIGEARIRLEEVLTGVAEEPSSSAGAIATPRRSVVPWLATAAVTLALAALAFVHFREAPAPVISSYLNAPKGAAHDFGLSSTVALGGGTPELSPDGKWIVFGARTPDNKASLWIQPLSSDTARMLTGTEGATFPFWSPNSRYVAFFSGGKLQKVDISGGPPVPIADAAYGRGGSWSAEDVIVFSPDLSPGPLLRIAASGGTPSPATSVEGSRVHRFPWFLPDGRHFIFEEQVNRGSVAVVLRIGSLDSQQTVEIGPASSNAVYSSGHLLFLRDATLMAQAFDPDKRSVQGEAVPVAEQVSWVLNDGRKGVFTVSSSGMLVYQAGGDAGKQKLSWFDRAGKVVSAVIESGDIVGLELSPDRKRAAVLHVDATGNTDTWIHDLPQNRGTRFTFAPAQDRRAVWSPRDGRALVWASIGGKQTLRRKSADGNLKTEEVLYEDVSLVDVTSWSPDGKFLLIDRVSRGMGLGIWSLPITPEKPGSPLKPTAFVDTTFDEGQGVISPDGHWVAYVSNESQQNEIYVTPFPGPGGNTKISKAGGMRPRWRHDSKEIFYAGLDGKLMAAEVTRKASSIHVVQVKPLGITLSTVGLSYDVSLDGQRILAITERERTSATPLRLVQNWTALLKR